jgi:SAM-dependent methyltransferase
LDHFRRIYAAEADRYQEMVAAEDAGGELAAMVATLAGTAERIVDVGTGTGRLAVPLVEAGSEVYGIDAAPAMLRVAARRLGAVAGSWWLSVGDARRLPVASAWAQGAIAGWVYGHFTEWHPRAWRKELDAALEEMDRVVAPGGLEVVVDTLGTAVDVPAAPTRPLAEYHARLETLGFSRTVISTGYRFRSVTEAIESLEWFFGLGAWARAHGSRHVPEFTGWWQRRRDQTTMVAGNR